MPVRFLALDTGSPLTSVAVAVDGRVAEERSCPQRESSAVLLTMVEAVLAASGSSLRELGGIVALRGPGSFTGLRVGLATVLGLHQASGVPATAVPTLEVLAAAAPGGRRVASVVDALRGRWFAQPFRSGTPPRPLGSAARMAATDLPRLESELLIGHGATVLGREIEVEGAEPPPLAGVAATLATHSSPAWDPGSLVRPLYLLAPAVEVPGPPKRVLGEGSR